MLNEDLPIIDQVYFDILDQIDSICKRRCKKYITLKDECKFPEGYCKYYLIAMNAGFHRNQGWTGLLKRTQNQLNEIINHGENTEKESSQKELPVEERKEDSTNPSETNSSYGFCILTKQIIEVDKFTLICRGCKYLNLDKSKFIKLSLAQKLLGPIPNLTSLADKNEIPCLRPLKVPSNAQTLCRNFRPMTPTKLLSRKAVSQILKSSQVT